jgi:hypothetical protein
MKKFILLLALVLISTFPSKAQTAPAGKIPPMFLGNFADDYGIRYTISESLWQQLPRSKFHIIRWNVVEQYLIARNDDNNPGERGLYTRIDFMRFDGMEPWRWGYCLTAYNAKSDKEAEAMAIADRANPKKGCNGFPFSRMKMVEVAAK